MGENTTIPWATHTWNPWEGCTQVGPGCDPCYAYARNIRFHGGANWGPGAPRRRTSVANWAKPYKWNEHARATGHPLRIMCGSLCDIFDREVPAQLRCDALGVVDSCRNLRWMLITKRIGNAEEDMQAAFLDHRDHVGVIATMVNQDELERDTGKLLAVRAAWWGISVEPQLGPLDLSRTPALLHRAETHPGRVWIISGGESYQRAFHPTRANVRGYNLGWAFSLKAQCAQFGIAYFQKQLGAQPYVDPWPHAGMKTMYVLDRDPNAGADPDDWPVPLRVQEFPEALK